MCVLGGGGHSDFFQGHAKFEVLCDQQAVEYMLLELRSKIWVDGTDVNIIKQEKVQIIIRHSLRKEKNQGKGQNSVGTLTFKGEDSTATLGKEWSEAGRDSGESKLKETHRSGSIR